MPRCVVFVSAAALVFAAIATAATGAVLVLVGD